MNTTSMYAVLDILQKMHYFYPLRLAMMSVTLQVTSPPAVARLGSLLGYESSRIVLEPEMFVLPF